MMNNLTKKPLTRLEATGKAQSLLASGHKVDELAAKIGISKPTLYKRITEHSWKLGELALLERI